MTTARQSWANLSYHSQRSEVHRSCSVPLQLPRETNFQGCYIITVRSGKFTLWESWMETQAPYTWDPDFTFSSAADKLSESGHFTYPHFTFPCIKLWMSLQTCPWAECSTQVLVIVTGVTLMARVQFAQLSTVRLHGACGSLQQCLLGSACWAVPAAPPGAACAQLCASVTSSPEETASSVTFPCMLSDTYSHSGWGWL